VAATGSAAALCVRNATYQEKSLLKNYTCTIQDTLVSTFLGTNVQFRCSTRPPKTANITGT
jgi:hypothetical protein